MRVLPNAISCNHNQLQCLFRLADFAENLQFLLEYFLIVLADDELCYRELYFANVDGSVTAVNDKVYLSFSGLRRSVS